MNDKRGDRYCGMALKRKARLIEVENKLSSFALDAESIADEILKVAAETKNSKLLEQGNKLSYEAMTIQGWIEG